MEFGLSEEQMLLKDSISRYLTENSAIERIHSFANNNEARAEDIWAGLCDLGLPGLLIDEEHGGVGLGMLDASLVAEALGHHAAPAPFLASMVMAPLAIASAGSEPQKSRWLPALANGDVIAGAALAEAVNSRLDARVEYDGTALNGRSLFVLDFEADIYLVADANRELYLVEANAPGLTRQLLTTIDKTRKVGELVFDHVAADHLPGSSDMEVCARIIDAARVILAADTLGAAQNMLNQAVAYSLQREQFGRVIGSFQAVKHMCAEMAADLEPCRAMMWYAAHALDAIPDEARLTACHTKAHLSEVGKFVAKTATEVHGGIGFTQELGLHYWFKRIGANRQLLGGPEQLREEAAKLQGLI
ncbi:MAG: acyl-CoA dehydrogenase family protein [Deltaproteobacteria bacterium]|nr:acyl-CoA dehydrogenase family protein [Deltaproteobacteria bacterium]